MPGNNQFGRGNIWASLKSLFDLAAGWYVYAGTPISGTSGTYVGDAGLGAILLDSTTGIRYVNLGTADSPIWTPSSGPVGIAANGFAGSGLGSVGNAKMTYDFAVDGGVQGTITPLNSPTLPAGAIILGGAIDITTALTSGGSATIGLGLGAGAQVAALKAPLAVASWTAVLTVPLIPLFTAATYVKVAAATRLTLTVATADLLTGRMDVNLAYVQGNT